MYKVLLLSESLAEYSSLKVLEHQYGKNAIPKTSLDRYLMGRTVESKKEMLMREPAAFRGSLVLLLNSLLEQKLNAVLRVIFKK
jgi:ABC-2 type transport system permease protein